MYEIQLLIAANFIKLVGTHKSCLAETGYQPTFHKGYIVATGNDDD